MKPDILSIDIETYGIVQGRPAQTTFHPYKMEALDRRNPSNIIETVAVSYYPDNDDTKPPTSHVYVWESPQDRRTFLDCINYLLPSSTLLGQNFKFDLLCLRYCSPEFKELTNQPGTYLDDLMILNFLDYEARPEKGLKPLSLLFGIDSYDCEVKGSNRVATSPHDPRLQSYNVRDAINTLLLYTLLKRKIGVEMPGSAKLGPICRQHRHDLLRLGLAMSEAGTAIDMVKLNRLHCSLRNQLIQIQSEATRRYGLKLSGPGSKSHRQRIVEAAVSPELLSHERLLRTEKTLEISTKLDNLRLIKTYQDPEHPGVPECDLLYRFASIEKLINSYTRPLRSVSERGVIVRNHTTFIHPTWHLVPSPDSKGPGDSGAKGTIQGRITCSKPGEQTFPKPILACLKSRFRGGTLLKWDGSQIELRVPAMLSCDPTMIQEYQRGEDRHANAAYLILDSLNVDRMDPKDHVFVDTWRQMGKTLNFLVTYLGQAKKYRDTLLKQAAEFEAWDLVRMIDKQMTVAVCAEVIRRFDERYPVFREWQRSLIREAATTGRIEVPTGWSRTFPGGWATVESLYINEIVNIPVQCIAAQLVQSAQATIINYLLATRSPVLVCSQTYDSITLDCPPGYEESTIPVVEGILTNPPLLSIIDKSQGRVPFKWELKKGK